MLTLAAYSFIITRLERVRNANVISEQYCSLTTELDDSFSFYFFIDAQFHTAGGLQMPWSLKRYVRTRAMVLYLISVLDFDPLPTNFTCNI